jgi:hypothetical protein
MAESRLLGFYESKKAITAFDKIYSRHELAKAYLGNCFEACDVLSGQIVNFDRKEGVV